LIWFLNTSCEPKPRTRAPLGGSLARIVVAVWLLASALPLHAARAQEVSELQITSKYYVVLDADTGEIYAQRGAHHHAAMASLTKVFTTVEALERAPLSTEITTDNSDLMDASATVMGFGPDERFSLQDLLYGMMLPSGNDAAHAIARGIGTEDGDASGDESVDRFVGWMNQRLQAMGLVDTHLANPHGWGVPNHYSSAYDLAAFTRYALHYPTFVSLISTELYDTNTGGYEVTNTNKMLNTYPGIIGGKTGYDDDAGYCLIEVAKRGDSTMISVTLDGVAPDDWYDDNRVLLDYAFDTKAAREKAGQPFVGDVVGYVDPAAALVADSFVAGGAATGQLATDLQQPTAVATNPAIPSASPTIIPAIGASVDSSPSGDQSGSGNSGFRIIAVAVAALLVIGVKLFDVARRNPTGGWSLRRPQPLTILQEDEVQVSLEEAAIPSAGGDQGDD
jgi:D-alanyl-D-alanine carboxypeptidase (penicillin-binding protein 5/6)